MSNHGKPSDEDSPHLPPAAVHIARARQTLRSSDLVLSDAELEVSSSAIDWAGLRALMRDQARVENGLEMTQDGSFSQSSLVSAAQGPRELSREAADALMTQVRTSNVWLWAWFAVMSEYDEQRRRK